MSKQCYYTEDLVYLTDRISEAIVTDNQDRLGRLIRMYILMQDASKTIGEQ